MTRFAPLLAMAMLLAAGSARAQESAPGPLGVGVIIGSPTGLSGKWRVSRSNSVDAAVGVGFGAGIHLHADWLYEGNDLLKESGATLGWYVGVGGRVRFDEDHPDDDDDDDPDQGKGNDKEDDTDLGARVPVGLDLTFATLRNLELFAEIALGLEVVDDPGLTLDGGVGVRWFF